MTGLWYYNKIIIIIIITRIIIIIIILLLIIIIIIVITSDVLEHKWRARPKDYRIHSNYSTALIIEPSGNNIFFQHQSNFVINFFCVA